MHRLTIFVAALGGLIVLTAAACGDTNNSTTPTAATRGAATTAATTIATAAGTQPAKPTTGVASATGQKASANNATRAQLQAAFEAAGIPNAANWAREVEEYRPYPTNDPNMAKLRQNLAKYNPPASVVDQIIAALSLDQ